VDTDVVGVNEPVGVPVVEGAGSVVDVVDVDGGDAETCVSVDDASSLSAGGVSGSEMLGDWARDDC
jgi:hypothetical protein